MSAVTTLPFSGPFTRADLEAMPDDGHRYELIDGILIVSPSMSSLHQRAVMRLILLLEQARPSKDFEVLPAPFDVTLADDTVMIPDILVARYADLTEKDLPTAPLLAVEVLSPSTRRFDLMVKHSRLEAARCPSYWVVDPDVPSLIVWELRDGAYAEVATVTGDETFHAQLPYPVDVTPRDLVTR
ncbi:MAG: Uma2 family endonuclease [Streptosporangiales bacterium]